MEISAAWTEMEDLTQWRDTNGFLKRTRAQQARYWFEQDVRTALLAKLDKAPIRDIMTELGLSVGKRYFGPHTAAASRLLVHLNTKMNE